jgi:hypothetical protein
VHKELGQEASKRQKVEQQHSAVLENMGPLDLPEACKLDTLFLYPGQGLPVKSFGISWPSSVRDTMKKMQHFTDLQHSASGTTSTAWIAARGGSFTGIWTC